MDTLIVTPSGTVAVSVFADDSLPTASLLKLATPVLEPTIDASAPDDLYADRAGFLTWAEVGRS